METNENYKKVLMDLFDEKDIDPQYRKKVNTDALLQEFSEAMKRCKENYAKIEKERRSEVIQTLTKDELQLIIDLYGQEIFSMYEKKHKVNLECIVR